MQKGMKMNLIRPCFDEYLVPTNGEHQESRLDEMVTLMNQSEIQTNPSCKNCAMQINIRKTFFRKFKKKEITVKLCHYFKN